MMLPKFPFRSLSRWELLTLLLFLMPLVFIAGRLSKYVLP